LLLTLHIPVSTLLRSAFFSWTSGESWPRSVMLLNSPNKRTKSCTATRHAGAKGRRDIDPTHS
jgi:hypothetical protein